MDSSRSGLLSTLLMTLPLIVVPAVALLRPPGQVGVSSVGLEASDAEIDDASFDEFDGFDADSPSDFHKEQPGSSEGDHNHGDERQISDDHIGRSKPEDEIFPEMRTPGGEPRGDFSPRHSPPRGTHKDPFLDDIHSRAMEPKKPREYDTEHVIEPDAVKPDASRIVEELNAIGALKTMWFEAGEKTPVGFAAFFRGPTELTRIRFESVGHSREACASEVLKQVTLWQQQNP